MRILRDKISEIKSRREKVKRVRDGGLELKIKASNLSHLYFYQEFRSELAEELDRIELPRQIRRAADMVNGMSEETWSALSGLSTDGEASPEDMAELVKRLGLAEDPGLMQGIMALAAGKTSQSLPLISIAKVAWAMNKTAESPNDIVSFDQWMEEYEDFDFLSCFDEIYAEIERGFISRRGRG